jgi:hypothetical protein
MLVIIAAVSMIGLQSLSTHGLDDLYKDSIQINIIQQSFEKTKRLNNSLLIYAGQTENIAEIKTDIINNALIIDRAMSTYTENVVNAENYKMIMSISGLMSIYGAALDKMIEYSNEGNTIAMGVLSLDIFPLRQVIDDEIKELSELNQALFEESILELEINKNNLLLLLAAISSVALAVLMILSVHLVKTVKAKPVLHQ